jgi:hypothetical protein
MIVRAFVVAMLAVLTLASSAGAECAWVLWHGVGRNPTWQRLDVFDKRSACIEVLDQKQHKQGLQGAHRASETSLWVVLGEAAWEDTCLPDTVDPRGAKGR